MLCNHIVRGLEQQLRRDGREGAALAAEIEEQGGEVPLLATDDVDDPSDE